MAHLPRLPAQHFIASMQGVLRMNSSVDTSYVAVVSIPGNKSSISSFMGVGGLLPSEICPLFGYILDVSRVLKRT